MVLSFLAAAVAFVVFWGGAAKEGIKRDGCWVSCLPVQLPEQAHPGIVCQFTAHPSVGVTREWEGEATVVPICT